MSDCIFCKIAAKQLPATIIYEDDEMIAFEDLKPLRPVHILVIPKKHIPSFAHLGQEDRLLMGDIMLVISQIAREKGIAETGYRIVNNCGEDGGQVVGHLHFHLLGGEKMKTAGN